MKESYLNSARKEGIGDYNVKGQRRIKEFQNQGRGPSAVEFLGSEDCSNAPFQISNVFVVSVGNKIHIVKIAC